MTERRLFESVVGLSGRLSHIPYGAEKPEDCGWRSSRNFTRGAPVLRSLGPCITWVPAEPDHTADLLPPRGTLWQDTRRQQRWLMRNHPEASLGNNVLLDQLAEDDATVPFRQEDNGNNPFFALGELTDTSLRRHAGVPLLVTVSGSADNILRLARVNQEKWTWSGEPNVTLRLGEMGTEKPAMWIDEDLGPIRRVKCFVDHTPYNPTRWVAVQRDSGTTILQPEYRSEPPDGSAEDTASRIAANPLVRISRNSTGGGIHSDVSFNPSARSSQRELAIIDERGFWSLWDVMYHKHRSDEHMPKMRMCGHIDRGVLEKLPKQDSTPTQWHKILWVGRSADDLDLLGKLDLNADSEELGPQTAFSQLHRSSSLLICNPQQVRFLDLDTGAYLPDLDFLRQDNVDCILDIHVTPDPQYFFVLTTSKLFIVRLYNQPGMVWGQSQKIWSIIYSTPHFRSRFDRSLRLALNPSVKPNQATSLVFVHSSKNAWTDIFYIEFSQTSPNQVKCQANVSGLRSLKSTLLKKAIRTLFVLPVPIIVNASRSLTDMGRVIAEKQLTLCQIAVLRSDMSIDSALCMYSSSSGIQIRLPNVRTARQSKTGPQKALRTTSYFFADDTDDDELAVPKKHSPRLSQRNIKAFYEHLNSVSSDLNEYHAVNSTRSVFNPFNTAYRSIEETLQTGLMPASTLFQIMPNSKQMSRQSFSALNWETELLRLSNIHPEVVVYVLNALRFRLPDSVSASLEEVYSKAFEITKSSIAAGEGGETHESRVVAISEQIFYDFYLSLYGIGYRSPIREQSQASTEENTLPDSQPETLPISPLRYETPVSAPFTPLSSRSQSEAVEGEDPAMTLLRSYTGTGNFVPERKLELLDKWQLGAEPADYNFDLERNVGLDVGKIRRAKQAAREDRKRRRTATLLQVSQEPELPATQPNPETKTFSSQPSGYNTPRNMIFSDPLVAMSQPAFGPFGRRPNKRIKKRKGGF